MNVEFRNFIKSEYEKVVAKEQKAKEAAEQEELNNRQKGAQKAVATKAGNKFIDMLSKKIKDVETPVEEPKVEPEEIQPEEIPVEEPETNEE